ncbi:ankyrin repeat and zinc finger domain-containing protein 1 isoform X1 [Epinephelus moara]|uniref:ankyrin repeat and zinc finger domain-containing protein 1 isoform X1 n=1 Tax=Epinephelus moara TaxID=300413 RepID=UPI00214EEF95|nr:ankyrin repeat and zinc finger domain-containing protein 1 isoform X1 [Epinephelus moara]XP_049905046.1 ankyrin repeat and zinc finger domain-containing protein 1 isoform X1 [Epinephelus moara]
MTTGADCRSVFHLTPNDEALTGLREVNSVLKQAVNTDPAPEELEDKSPEDERQRESSLVREVSDKMVCSACKCPFISREDQMEHYKLDWHRFNLRLKISGMPSVTADEFERKTGAGDMSSISGSESDSEEDSDSESGGTYSNVTGTDNESSAETSLFSDRLSSKVVFQNSAGQYLSVYRCILQGKSDDEQDAASSLKAISNKTVWVILMTGGGHFAGAVFQGKEVLQHKTFHRYTVRAKRGTAQGLRDSQNRSHTPKSAGAALRRHNEAALVKDIQDLLVSWAEHLKEASTIFVRAPSYNKSIFFGGRLAPLDKKDPRVRTLPFPTRRATFREAQRVHEVLSAVHVYGKETDVSAVFSPAKKTWKKTVKPTAEINTSQETAGEKPDSSDEEDGGEIQLEMVELTIGTLDLRESEIYPPRHRRRRRKKKEETKLQNEELSNTEADNQEEEVPEATPAEDAPQETQSKNKRKRKAQSKKQLEEIDDESSEYALRDEMFTACKVGDVDALCRLLQLPGETSESQEQPESNPSDIPSPLTILNKPIDSTGFTLLHVASAAAQKAVVRLLLDAGADPACRNNKGQTPYIVAPDKDTRNVFRKYMGENPDKYDYIKAQVPGPLTAEIESKKTEKKKAQKALRKQREKEQKEEKRKQESEAEEKKRFASLTDREKRALAAERRLAEQVAATGVGLSNVKRCWMCGESLLGKIPFQYLEFSFCTPRCVQAHRKANALPGKT